eukprot:166542-Chlamydomonas_euryale.AAC.1
MRLRPRPSSVHRLPACWLAGWLAGGRAGWWAGGRAGGLAGRLAGGLAGGRAGCLPACLPACLLDDVSSDTHATSTCPVASFRTCIGATCSRQGTSKFNVLCASKTPLLVHTLSCPSL